MATRNENGFALLEVLIAAVIGVIVALAVAKAAVNATTAERSSSLDLTYTAMMSRVENAIDDPMLCRNLWTTWNLDGPISPPATFSLAKFDHTVGSPPTVVIDRLTDGDQVHDIARTVASGGPPAGLTVDSMKFIEPVQVADGTYEWTFVIQTTKVAPGGASFLGNATTIRKMRVEVTTSGPPGYLATYCGPVVSPEANQQVPMLRFTTSATTFCANNPNSTDDATKDTACAAEFGPTYSAATLQDLTPYRMIYFYSSTNNAVPPTSTDQFLFAVADQQNPNIFTNSFDPAAGGARQSGTVVAVKQAALGVDTCHIACIRNTAPMRFVRGFHNPGDVGKTALCQAALGTSYSAATVNDLLRFGFRLANGDSTTSSGGPDNYMDQFAPGAIFDGPGGIGCRLGYTTNTNGGTKPVGPALDCTPVLGPGFPLACVLR